MRIVIFETGGAGGCFGAQLARDSIGQTRIRDYVS
jgi:hypothetical protein